MLQTSAFPVPPALLGSLWVYPLPARFQQALTDLGERWRTKNDRARAPYASLANALAAATGRPVRILPRTRMNAGDALLITTEPIDPAILAISVRTWERLCRGGADLNVLAPLLADVAPVRTPLTEAVQRPAPGKVTAEPWIYKVLGWVMAERLAVRPVAFDGREVSFRLDSHGSLIAWDDLVLRERKGKKTARALVRITPHIKTMPGVGDLVCILDVGLARLRDRLYDVRHVWIDHGREHGGSALLRLPVGYFKGPDGNRRVLCDFSADIVTACGLDALPWGEDVLSEHPDRVRASRATNDEHPIGTGAGPRTYLRLVEHATKAFGVAPIGYEPFTAPGKNGRAIKVSVISQPVGHKTPVGGAALDAAIAAAGYTLLRIVHLTGTPATRRRLRDELNGYRLAGMREPTPELGVAQPLTERTDVIGYDLPCLLGDDAPETDALLAQAPMLKAEDGTLVLALVETPYDGEKNEKDIKRCVRRALASLGVASQFLSSNSLQDSDKDHPAGAAIRDLLRVGGFTDDRLRTATQRRGYPLEEPVWTVGVHVRRQNSANGKGRPALVAVVTAVHATPVPDRPWEMLFYVPGVGWRPHAEGLASFHAGAIGAPIVREKDAYAALRDLVDQALGTLPGGGRDPVVVMVDADAGRRVWPGLGDQRLGEGPLPGDGLPDASGIGVVRVCAEDTEIPRPVHRTVGGPRSKDPGAPAQPGAPIYVHEGEDGRRSWMLGRTSVTYASGIVGRCGADYTRFTLPEEKKALQGKPWHSFTGTEIVVARPGSLGEEASATFTARLCAQPVSWGGRTRWPVPLHLARIADADHPSYRSEDG